MKSTHKTGKINTHKDNISKVNINLYNKISIINNHSTINSRLRKGKNQYIKMVVLDYNCNSCYCGNFLIRFKR